MFFVLLRQYVKLRHYSVFHKRPAYEILLIYHMLLSWFREVYVYKLLRHKKATGESGFNRLCSAV